MKIIAPSFVTYRALLVSVVELHLELTDCLSTFLNSTTDFRQEINRRWLGFGEDVYVVRGHTFLGNEHLFGTIYDEVSSGIVRAFIQVK